MERPTDCARDARAPRVAFRELRSVWFQVTGTLCNLACRHCLNASGPKDPWLRGLDGATVRHYIAEADALGVREFYFTGGEPFLHPEILELLESALAVAPTTVLTNGILIDERLADRLVTIADDSPYSLEVRISLEAVTASENDLIRGRGSFDKALNAIRLLSARGLLPIVTVTEILTDAQASPLYERIRAGLRAAGLDRPRIKILPVLPIGRCGDRDGGRYVTRDNLDGFDTRRLQCTETRVVADGGIYACPILAGLPGARMSRESLTRALKPTPLYHTACFTCYATGMTCKNF